jgi:hypothetical protein
LENALPDQARAAFISYCREDSEFALRLAKDLKAAGARVWLDQLDIVPGYPWDNAIEDALLEANQMLIVLSPASAKSSNVRDEIAYALEQGKIIIPVLYMDCAVPLRLQRRQRIDFRTDYALGLASLMQNLQVVNPDQTVLDKAAEGDAQRHAAWEARDAEERRRKELAEQQKQLQADESERPTLAEPTGGTVPLESRFYVVRPADQKLRMLLERGGVTVVLKGAPQMGRSSLLVRALEHAREAGKTAVLLDLQTLADVSFESLDSLYRALGAMISDQLDLDRYPQDIWRSDFDPSVNFTNFMGREVLPKIKGDLILAFDETDRIFNHPFSQQVFGTFRAWHGRRALPNHRQTWSRFSIIIAVRTDPHAYIDSAHQSPFNVGELIQMEDFSLQQVQRLNEAYGRPLKTEAEVSSFFSLLDGHPYLTRRGLSEINDARSLEALIEVASSDDGPFGDHLRGILSSITRDESFLTAAKDIFRTRPVSDLTTFYRLCDSGIVAGSPQKPRLRCGIYRSYLSERITDEAVNDTSPDAKGQT